jgi:adenylate cyclase
MFVTILHPDIAGRRIIWYRGRPVERYEAGYDLLEPDPCRTKPFGAWDQRTGMALRLDDDVVAREFPILDRMRAEGFTDYLATPLHFTNGEIHVVSWATRQPAGFADEDRVALTTISQPLARIIEIHSLRRTNATLLETYIGRNAGAPFWPGIFAVAIRNRSTPRSGSPICAASPAWPTDCRLGT